MMSAVGFHEIHSQNYFSQPPLKRTRIDGPYSFNHQNIPQSSVASRTSYLPSPGTGTPPPFCPVTATSWTNQIPFTPSNQNITCVPSFYSPTVIFPGQQSEEEPSSIGTEFDPEKLKTRHESVIRSLYADIPRQCSTCGMRFRTIEENTKHIHWHVRKNLEAKKNREKKNKTMVSRKYFWGLKEWLCAAETIGNVKGPAFKVVEEEMNKKKCDKVFCDVIADEFHKVCPLCLERFDEYFSNDANDWMFREAVRFNPEKIPERRLIRSLIGSVVHGKCVSGLE